MYTCPHIITICGQVLMLGRAVAGILDDIDRVENEESTIDFLKNSCFLFRFEKLSFQFFFLPSFPFSFLFILLFYFIFFSFSAFQKEILLYMLN